MAISQPKLPNMKKTIDFIFSYSKKKDDKMHSFFSKCVFFGHDMVILFFWIFSKEDPLKIVILTFFKVTSGPVEFLKLYRTYKHLSLSSKGKEWELQICFPFHIYISFTYLLFIFIFGKSLQKTCKLKHCNKCNKKEIPFLWAIATNCAFIPLLMLFIALSRAAKKLVWYFHKLENKEVV